MRKSTFLFTVFLQLVLFPSVSLASCLDGLARFREYNYQPKPICDSTSISKCFSEPPLLFLFDIPPVDHQQLGLLESNQQSYQRNIYDLLLAGLNSKRYLEYSCLASNLKGPHLYSCYTTSSRRSPMAGSIPIYQKGMLLNSSRPGISFVKYTPDLLTNYLAEYRCVPGDNSIVKLFQFHFGQEQRPYFKNDSPLFVNPTGHILGVLRISTIPRTSFEQSKKTKPRIGFTMDPAAIAPIIEKAVPNSLR